MADEIEEITRMELGPWMIVQGSTGKLFLFHHGVEIEDVSSWELTPEVERIEIGGIDGHWHSFEGRTKHRLSLEVVINRSDQRNIPKLKEDIRNDAFDRMVDIVDDLQKKLAKAEQEKEKAIDTILERIGKAKGKQVIDSYGDTETLYPIWAKRVFKGFRDHFQTFKVFRGK
jgi:hypothetical protein